MNSKKAKALRRALKNLQKQNPNLPEVNYLENERNRKTVAVENIDPSTGKLVTNNIVISAGTVTVNLKSIRGVYLRLKKDLEKTK